MTDRSALKEDHIRVTRDNNATRFWPLLSDSAQEFGLLSGVWPVNVSDQNVRGDMVPEIHRLVKRSGCPHRAKWSRHCQLQRESHHRTVADAQDACGTYHVVDIVRHDKIPTFYVVLIWMPNREGRGW